MLKILKMVGGYPCQPYSAKRWLCKGGTSAKTCSNRPADHPGYDVLMSEFPAYLKTRRPGAFVLEQVEGRNGRGGARNMLHAASFGPAFGTIPRYMAPSGAGEISDVRELIQQLPFIPPVVHSDTPIRVYESGPRNRHESRRAARGSLRRAGLSSSLRAFRWPAVHHYCRVRNRAGWGSAHPATVPGA